MKRALATFDVFVGHFNKGDNDAIEVNTMCINLCINLQFLNIVSSVIKEVFVLQDWSSERISTTDITSFKVYVQIFFFTPPKCLLHYFLLFFCF